MAKTTATRERIDITVPDSVLTLNDEKIERLERTHRFEPTDRVPVVVGVEQWTILAARGTTAGQYVRSPRDNLREQLLNRKWRMEHVRDDAPIDTESITLGPDLGCLRGVEFISEVVWQEDQPPKCVHPLACPEQIDTLAVPEPRSGVNAKLVEHFEAMRDAAGDFDVRLNGKRLRVDVTFNHFGGPIPSAFALAGANLLEWMLSEPERTHRLMDIVTESHLRCIGFADEVMGRDADHPVAMGADAAEMVGPATFREFVVPYYRRVWERFPGTRALHMCGRIDHLLSILRDELEITHLTTFGSPVDRRALAEAFAGRVVTSGGPDPMLIRSGPTERIVQECIDYIRTVGSRGGYTLGVGGGTAVGTPPEHIAFMVEASRQAEGA